MTERARVVIDAHDGPDYVYDPRRGYDSYGIVPSTVEERTDAFTTYAPACHHPSPAFAQNIVSVEETGMTPEAIAGLAVDGLDNELRQLTDNNQPE